MKSTFIPPRVTRQGSLRKVTATISGTQESDARLKRDIEPYDPVLPRLKEVSSVEGVEESKGRGGFEEPVVRREGSLKNVTATVSGPTVD